jgi:hypothetical protein
MSYSDDTDADAEIDRNAQHYLRLNGITPFQSYRDKQVEYQSVEVPPIEIQIPLWEYFERIKQFKVDRWQRHFCDWLEDAVATRHIAGKKGEFHAEPQLGKTTILSQVYPAWCIGHDPFWRTALAMYNQSRSETHSEVIISILRSETHKEIFTNSAGHLPNVVSKSGWSTNARKDIDSGRSDGQKTFAAVGLISGITGSSADLYIVDDPYKDPKEAFSQAVRESLDRFWKMGIQPRLNTHSIIAAMFHRYAYDDFGGYLLDTGLFDYIRYASIADGDYVHDETGQRFPDPLGREIGEYISERRGAAYYAEKKKDVRVWNSMFLGRPSSEEGDFFKVKKFKKLAPAEFAIEWEQCILRVRAWDNAATTGAGDYTAGALMGIKPNGEVLVADMKLAQVDTAERLELQKKTALEDGPDVVIVIPKELAQTGKDNVFFTEKELEGYTVVARSVISGGDAAASSPKARRAYNFSVAVNSGEASYLSDEDLPDDAMTDAEFNALSEEDQAALGTARWNRKWNKTVLTCMRQFLLSEFDDPIDALGDGYNQLHEVYRQGLVVKNYKPQRNLLAWQAFSERFGKCRKIPANFTVYVGVKITPLASQANSAVLVARAPLNARMGEKLFVVAEYKEHTDDYAKCFDWIERALKAFCSDTKTSIVWLHQEGEQYKQTLWQKLKIPVTIFAGDEFAGINELDWYLKATAEDSPFGTGEKDAGLYGLVMDEKQISVANDVFGLYAFRQELATWFYDDKKKPTKVGAVLECVRMVTYAFRTSPVGLTDKEKVEDALPEALRVEAIEAMPESPDKDSMITRRNLEISKAMKDVNKPVQGAHSKRFARR